MISEERAEKAVEFIRDHADELGKLWGQCKALEHRRKIVRSAEFLEVKQGSVAEREARAETAEEYERIVNEYENAWADLKTLETKLKAAELTIDVWRSQYAASKRGHV